MLVLSRVGLNATATVSRPVVILITWIDDPGQRSSISDKTKINEDQVMNPFQKA